MANSMTKYREMEEEKAQLTENGMSTNNTTLNNCVDLFFSIGAMRGKNKVTLIEKFSKAYSENPLVATRILFWVRDVREGAGERQIFRDVISHLVKLSPDVVKKNVHLISEYGRWDDVFTLIGTELEGMVIDLIVTALGNEDGLCAKWMPRKGEVFNKVRRSLKVSPKELRKRLVGLTDVVETKMRSNRWKEIDYSKIPSLASARYQKAFWRRDEKGYNQFVEDLKEGKTTVNSGALYPYDILKTLYTGVDETVSQNQWDNLPNFMEGNEDRVLPMVDVSGSMSCAAGSNDSLTCMDVAISLGIYISERNEGTFKDSFLTFSSTPSLQYLTGDSLKGKLEQLRSAHWGMSTNLTATFDLLLDQAVTHNIPLEEMPTKILILSDMEFDEATGNRWEGSSDWNPTAMEMIKTKYEEAGYEIPTIVFWNLHSRGNDNFPVKQDEMNTALISGFSPSILKSVLNGENLTPYSVMMKTVDSTRYENITV